MLDLSIVVSGAAGQGVQTVGYTLAKTASRSGYAVFAWQDNESRIRGGSNSMRIRITLPADNSPRADADILVSLDGKSRKKYLPLLRDNGLVLTQEDDGSSNSVSVPFEELAMNAAGKKIYANTVVAGALAAMAGMSLDILLSVVREGFESKGDDVVQANLKAAAAGFSSAGQSCSGRCSVSLPPRQQRYYLITGSDALAIGAAAGGCRFISAYPMSPSTGIVTLLSRNWKSLGVLAEQAEDEIAAINMAIGASYAGTRAMTATSGGGFALMTEAISLAGMTETPVVVVVAQRPGPATGLPTRTEQADLLFAINGGHGEFPKFVLAPSDAEDAFHTAIRAFILAEQYQVPAIVLVDQLMMDSYYTVSEWDLHSVANQSFYAEPGAIEDYRRYRITPEGISPMLKPGMSHHLMMTDSDEHDEYGHITEDAGVRKSMMDKRLGKVRGMRKSLSGPDLMFAENADTVLLTWGSTKNAALEAVKTLRARGEAVGLGHFTDVWPLPVLRLKPNINYITVESNATGQLGAVLRSQTGLDISGSILRYDGFPMDAAYILDALSNKVSVKV